MIKYTRFKKKVDTLDSNDKDEIFSTSVMEFNLDM